MKKLLLIGAGGFGRVVLEQAINEYSCAFLDDGNSVAVDGIPVIGRTNDMKDFFPEYMELLVTIGDNTVREKLYKKAAAIGFTFPNIIHPSAFISPYAHIGVGCVILNHVVIQNNSKCGDGCILNPGVELHHDSIVGSYCLIYTNSVVRSLTHVGDRVWIGSNTTISTGASVPSDTVIKDCSAYTGSSGTVQFDK